LQHYQAVASLHFVFRDCGEEPSLPLHFRGAFDSTPSDLFPNDSPNGLFSPHSLKIQPMAIVSGQKFHQRSFRQDFLNATVSATGWNMNEF
jgi:hypothetical protein